MDYLIALIKNGAKFRELSSRTESEMVAAVRTTLGDMLSTGTLANCDFREGGLTGVELLHLSSNPSVHSSSYCFNSFNQHASR
jgi:hypothetical protein